MTILFVALEKALARIHQDTSGREVTVHLLGSHPACLAVDPHHPHYVYCGTFDRGLWRSSDMGLSWEQASEGISSEQVMSVAVSAVDQVRGAGIVYAGTEPSALYRSEDRAQSWHELSSLCSLPSAPSWSFPPRPWTSHVRCITCDPVVSGRIFAAIEAGALVRSLDGGESWEDRKPDGPFDTHTLAMSALAPHRLYSAAGDGFMLRGQGFAQSNDGGESWFRFAEGLQHHYLWSVAVDAAVPDTVLISAASSPQTAHQPQLAESAIYRRTDQQPWQQLEAGLPASKGMLASVLAAHPAEPGLFYAGNNHGVFLSADAGENWEAIPVCWPANVVIGRVQALVAVPE